jgi:hypothetical protein
MIDKKDYWFEANKNNPGWHAVNKKGKTVEAISILLALFILIFNVSPFNLNIELWVAFALFLVTFIVIPVLKGEPNPRNQVFLNWWKPRKNSKH